MRIRAALWAAVLAAASPLVAGSVAADPRAPQPERDVRRVAQAGKGALDEASKDAQKAGQDVKKGAEKAGQDVKKGAEKAAEDVKKDAKAVGREISKELREAREKLRQTREERRKEERKAIRDKYGALLANPQVREELRTHFRRIAQIDYMDELANDLNLDKIEERVDRARDLEKERHDQRMQALKAKGGGK